jgi:hypothetical protein
MVGVWIRKDRKMRNEDLIAEIATKYEKLLEKDFKYQMGDDDFQPSTEEGNLIRAIKTIVADLRKNKDENDASGNS